MLYSELNNNEFLNYYLESNLKKGINRNGLKKINFNKKSISVKIENQFYFNDFFNETSLLNEIIKTLQMFIIQNDLNLCYDMDYLEHKFKKININYQR